MKESDKKLYYIENEKEYIFYPILKFNNDNSLTFNLNYRYDELPDLIYGKIIDNYVGYNPSGWWRYINIEKRNLIYK